MVMRVVDEQPYPDHPDRFEHYEQVLCKEPLSDRCYWEAEWSRGVNAAVAYKGIRKKGGSDCRFGWNEKSWGLFCTPDRYSAWHDYRSIDILVHSDSSNRIAVYLDRSAGTLSFYSVSDEHTLTHIHTFNAKFTEPLYAGFSVYGSVSIVGFSS